MARLDPLHSIAVDLTRSMAGRDRHARIVETVRGAIPCDAAALLRAERGGLRPLAVHGLVRDVLGRRFELSDHPRMAEIAAASGPHLFPADSPLPDPYDGLIDADEPHLTAVHSCLGVPLRVDDQLVGVLTADALSPGAFDAIDRTYLSLLGALVAGALRTGLLLEEAESRAEYERSVARAVLGRADPIERDILGESRALDRIRSEVGLVAGADLAVLITGESGVGKESVARAVHANSDRREGPLVVVNCAALPDSLAESELFGHVRGAFTGADRVRPGRFEAADGGTLFLDEVGELPLALQPKLLRVLQEGEVQRVGSDSPRAVDVRIVAATNRDPVAAIDDGSFRADLYHRLCQFPIHVPPLRERPEDLPVLTAWFAERAQQQLGTGPVRLTRAAHERLAQHGWPGNVRELQNVIARVVLRAAAGASETVVVDEEALASELGESALDAPPVARNARDTRPLGDRVEEFKRETIRSELEAHGGNLAAAARALGVARSNLYTTAKRLGLR